jgi:hypothetical protein
MFCNKIALFTQKEGGGGPVKGLPSIISRLEHRKNIAQNILNF